MIQRIQTLYLLLAVALGIVAMVSTLGTFCSAEGAIVSFDSLRVTLADGTRHVSTAPLMAILLTESLAGLYCIFKYANRRLQLLLCRLCLLMLGGWYVVFGVYSQVLATGADWQFKPAVAAFLPMLCAVCHVLAIRGIRHDEKLVRAADRIR